MDWGYVGGTIIASVVAASLVSGAAVFVALRVGVARLEERVTQKFESFASATTQRVDDYKTWRAGLETRITAHIDHLADHEKECRDRWEKLLERYGGMRQQLDMITEELSKRVAHWEKLLGEHGGVMERLRSIDEQLQRSRRR